MRPAGSVRVYPYPFFSLLPRFPPCIPHELITGVLRPYLFFSMSDTQQEIIFKPTPVSSFPIRFPSYSYIPPFSPTYTLFFFSSYLFFLPTISSYPITHNAIGRLCYFLTYGLYSLAALARSFSQVNPFLAFLF